jgi:hypothetical protein
MEGSGFEGSSLSFPEDSIAGRVANVVMPEDLGLCEEPALAKLAGRAKEIDCAFDPAFLGG